MNMKNLKHNHIYLHKAIRMRNPDLVRLLLRTGINPNEPDENGKIIIFYVKLRPYVFSYSLCKFQ